MERSRAYLQDYGIALLRLMVGFVFLAHGSQKLFGFGFSGFAGALAQIGVPAPNVFSVIVILVEFLGGILLILGLFTRWAALLIAIEMVVAVFAVHLKNGFFLPRGYEFALTMLVANVSLMLTGAGAFALDNLIGRSRPAHTDIQTTAA